MFHPFKFTFIIIIFLLFGISQTARGQDELFAKLATANKIIYSDPEKSILLAKEVYKNSPENSNLQLSSLIILGTAYSEKFDIQKSIESLLKAQRIAELKNDYVNQVRALSLLGYQYQILQINDNTHSYLDQAEKIINQHALPDSLQYLRGNNYSIKAMIYQETLDCDYSIEYFNKAISVYKKLKNSDVAKTNLCIAHLHKSLCFIENKNADSAKISLLKSDAIIKQIPSTDDIEISQQIAWAKYHKLNKKYKTSIETLDKILKKATKMSKSGLDVEAYQLLSQNYLALNDIPKYNYYSNLYTETKKRYSEAEKNSITHIINKPSGNAVVERFTFSENKIYIIVIFLILIIILIIFFSFKSYRLKNKMRDLKSNQNSESK
ncbi:tetratricopeptide repeat protein [Chryseobacterium sp. FH1]|uniref:tetratricopeptide repeat protein n=1 Tax=Chryseobacterium sp. FH1 TaxID=1233951 RepID=UPI0004E3DD16|nr:hypothetical protein [Chryseobacterium sp. FH1]KFC18470.1 hypothetical protein IO90_18370 [Chryseobacterium sp. FH1]